jgi:hypothetical protein
MNNATTSFTSTISGNHISLASSRYCIHNGIPVTTFDVTTSCEKPECEKQECKEKEKYKQRSLDDLTYYNSADYNISGAAW